MVRLDGKWQGCNANSLTNSCIGNYWCHLGARPLTTVCCPGGNFPIFKAMLSTN